MANKNVTIELLNDSEIDSANDFHNRIYNDKRTREQFTWEFFHAPAGKAIYVVAKDSDTKQIVGTQCAIPIELIKADGTVILTAKSEDTLVDPAYRGLSIFENMYQLLFAKCREQGIKYIWGFTTAKKPFLKLGFEIPYDHSQSLLVRDISTSYRYLAALNPKNTAISRLKIVGLCTLSKVLSLKRTFAGNGLKAYTYSEQGQTIHSGNEHLLPVTKYNGYWIRQTLPYLQWRISDNPYPKITFNITFSSHSDLVAQLNFNHHKDGVWYLVNDVYASGLAIGDKAAILRKAMSVLISKHRDVKLIRTWDFTHNAYGKDEILTRAKAGFLHIDRGISFVWKRLDDDTLNAIGFNLTRMASQGVI